jgi:hypothetical protein
MIGALLLLFGGIILTGDLIYAWQVSPFVLRCLGPAALVAGVAATLRAAFPNKARIVGGLCFITGLIMLLLGVFPWAYTPYIIEDRGGEGSGMLGTLIFIFAAPTGLLLTLLGMKWSRE